MKYKVKPCSIISQSSSFKSGLVPSSKIRIRISFVYNVKVIDTTKEHLYFDTPH
jgi:hypothetical protein